MGGTRRKCKQGKKLASLDICGSRYIMGEQMRLVETSLAKGKL